MKQLIILALAGVGAYAIYQYYEGQGVLARQTGTVQPGMVPTSYGAPAGVPVFGNTRAPSKNFNVGNHGNTQPGSIAPALGYTPAFGATTNMGGVATVSALPLTA